jgi:hypothetical protein
VTSPETNPPSPAPETEAPATDDDLLAASLKQATEMRRNGEPEGANRMYNLIISNFGQSADPHHDEMVARSQLAKAMTLVDLSLREDAIAVFADLRVRINGRDEGPWHEISVLSNYEEGMVLGMLDDHQGAARCFKAAADLGTGDERAAVVHIIAAALYYLAIASLNCRRVGDAMDALAALEARFGDGGDVTMRHWVEEGRALKVEMSAIGRK